MEIGHHCSVPTCNRLDFLPFTCELCKLEFCQDHKLPQDHECHYLLQLTEDSTGDTKHCEVASSSLCSVPDCGRVGTIEIICIKCHNIYCVKHRHPIDHNCLETLTTSTISTKVKVHTQHKTNEQSKSTSTRKMRGAKSSSLSAKVALMRLKQRAEGVASIPESEKVYFEIILPHEYGQLSKPVFVSKIWTVGKVVDYLSEKYKVRNNNDKVQAKKLLLFTSDGEILVMRQSIESIEETYPSGTTLYLEYENDYD